MAAGVVHYYNPANGGFGSKQCKDVGRTSGRLRAKGNTILRVTPSRKLG